jgi:outer membrane protein, heavy metal efflux system
MCARLFLSILLTSSLAGAARAAESQRLPDDLGREAHLESVLRVVLARNPDLAEELARVNSARVRVDEASRLPDLQLKYEQWGVPLRRPLALREANALMLGLSRTLPAAGTRDARSRMAAEEVSRAAASEQIRRSELRAQVRRAFADYYRADRELRLHREHVDLTARLVELSRASYRAGKRAQQDVLRLGLELSRLHRDLAHIQQERISAQALLNALMNRPPESPLGPPAELDPAAAPTLPPGQATTLQARRPEVAAAAAALRRSEAAVDLARRERRWPSVSIGADYMYMPLMEDGHAYGAMVMLNLPWLSGARRDAVRAAEHALTADRLALESVRNVVRYQLRDAQARHDAARSTFSIVDQDLLPQAQRSYDSAYSAYASGQGDAIGLVDGLRSLLEVRIDRVRALVHLATTAADLARVSGEKENGK